MREFSLQQKMDAQGTHLSLGQLSFLPHFFERNHLAPALLRRVGRFRRGRCRCRFHEAADLLSRTSLHIVGDMRVGVQCEARAVVAQHAGQGLHIHTAGDRHRGECVPLRYNKDKREKPVFSMGLSVCRSHFNSFSNIETDAKI